ncbi:DNA translocase FtsK [Halothiobacillus sp.]|uniref:DNA translocase FtsK n=1 Tax=Halothiobacillus sp. TaxID=1891311 RepID=UPI002AD3788E|nr:DNA translocase FtsK 4TM domain-containing protein [Halothiobacillus sp.]
MSAVKHTMLFQPQRMVADLFLIGLILVMGYYSISLFTYSPGDPGFSTTGQNAHIHNAGGLIGAWLADFSRFLLGYGAYALPPMVLVFALRQFVRLRAGNGLLDVFMAIQIGGVVLTIFAVTVLASIHQLPPDAAMGVSAGGVIGNVLATGVIHYLGALGGTVLMLGFLMLAFSTVSGLSWFAVFELVGRLIEGLFSLVVRMGSFLSTRSLRTAPSMGGGGGQSDFTPAPRKRASKPRESSFREDPRIDASSPAAIEAPKPLLPALAKKGRNLPGKTPRQVQPVLGTENGLPIVDLLDFAPKADTGYSPETLQAMSQLIEDRLEEFGVRVDVVAATPGPVITRFELQPAAGVKVSQISNLAKDLARALSIISVRVVEVIPGKSTVGLEIPNQVREIIALRELIESKHYQDSRSPLTIALGKDIAGGSVTADLARMPHLLVAGTTGSGKSVGVNAMILSLLYKATADDVRLILIDPKMLELSVYEGIPHLLAPVVTDMKEAANALRWAVGEMERRYKLMSSLGVRNLAGCNEKISAAAARGEPLRNPFHNPAEALDPDLPAAELERLPFIVIVVDEFADMMMVVGKKVEELIARLAQKARASGIHLILATQRPSVDVITGLIKANIPTRISFQVSSKIDSRTILDQMGAESLLGHGDMLFLPPGTGLPKRVHGAFVSDDEVHRVVEALKALGEPNYIEAVLSDESASGITLPGEKPVSASGEVMDEYYDQAVAIVTETRKASISYVQRRLKIGYNRAARLVEEMENDGIVGQLQANGSREVLAPPPPK